MGHKSIEVFCRSGCKRDESMNLSALRTRFHAMSQNSERVKSKVKGETGFRMSSGRHHFGLGFRYPAV